ncbi:hypothetical protein FGO68_gene2999 [Halteria grandinella]|uniref:Uncharacterized protein n=1 Tax=Halteria grandinella TaxID=5974 RepID=A0A8J8T3F6_HALGN|nr:hypothetical protein FGO68_gene2999 [Halteria grandinella]
MINVDQPSREYDEQNSQQQELFIQNSSSCDFSHIADQKPRHQIINPPSQGNSQFAQLQNSYVSFVENSQEIEGCVAYPLKSEIEIKEPDQSGEEELSQSSQMSPNQQLQQIQGHVGNIFHIQLAPQLLLSSGDLQLSQLPQNSPAPHTIVPFFGGSPFIAQNINQRMDFDPRVKENLGVCLQVQQNLPNFFQMSDSSCSGKNQFGFREQKNQISKKLDINAEGGNSTGQIQNLEQVLSKVKNIQKQDNREGSSPYAVGERTLYEEKVQNQQMSISSAYKIPALY